VRGVGGNSCTLGTVQEDAIRNITGTFVSAIQTNPTSGTFYLSAAETLTKQYSDNSGQVAGLDASRVALTVNENRPISMALLTCIKI